MTVESIPRRDFESFSVFTSTKVIVEGIPLRENANFTETPVSKNLQKVTIYFSVYIFSTNINTKIHSSPLESKQKDSKVHFTKLQNSREKIEPQNYDVKFFKRFPLHTGIVTISDPNIIEK